jgi:anti-sigma factor RsiW
MNCEDLKLYLPVYLDDELDISGSLRVEQHLADCAGCCREREEFLALRAALREPGLYARPSADLAKRIDDAVRRTAKVQVRSARASWVPSFGWLPSFRWASAVAVIGIAIGFAGLLAIRDLRTSKQQAVATAILAGHIRSLQADHLVDVPSSDRHTVKPWFQGKLDFAPTVPDLSELGWPLIGGRLDYIDGRPVAALVYKRRMHNINVFIWPTLSSSGNSITQEDAQGYQILHWNGAEMTYWVVSDLSYPELLDLARALRGH